jgi:hypothetical protein
MNLPTKSSRVRLDQLHPKFISRLEHFFADGRIAGKVTISSGCRSYADQMAFYRKYLAGRGNLAANPDRRFGPKGFDGQGIWRGSWHMEQFDGYCHAVDLHIIGKGISKKEVNDIAISYGIVPTIQKKEWWHHQWRSAAAEEFPAPAIDGAQSETKQTPPIDWAGIAAAIEMQRQTVRKSPLRLRSKNKAAVKALQQRLGAIGFDAGKPDGIFGRKTLIAVRRYQRSAKVHPVDGIVGIKTWDAMWRPDGDISGLYS